MISLRYFKCYVIDGLRLVHGLKCECTARDKFLWALNMPGAE